MSEYSVQPSSTAFSAVTLTAAFSGNQHTFDAAGFHKLSIDINYAMGAAETANTLELQLEHSPDNGLNWYKLVIDNTSTFSVITARAWQMSEEKLNVIVDIAYKKMRMSIKETGVATNFGTATVAYTLTGN